MPAALPALEVSPRERGELERLVRASSTSQQTAVRAQIVLAAADGEPSRRIAARLGVSEPTVKLWRRSFADRGLDGLADRPRSGRPRRYDDEQIARVVAKTLEPPPQGETHWSARRLAEATGLSHATVHRIWREHKLRRPLHVVLDNSSTHTTPEITTWLARHPRVHFHFTPKGASWMNLVEAWFSILTRQQLRRGAYHDVAALITAITSFITSYNSHPRPFAWTKTANAILTKARPHTKHTSETEH